MPAYLNPSSSGNSNTEDSLINEKALANALMVQVSNLEKRIEELNSLDRDKESLEKEIEEYKVEAGDYEGVLIDYNTKKAELEEIEKTISNKKDLVNIVRVRTDHDYTDLNKKKTKLRSDISVLEGKKQEEFNRISVLQEDYRVLDKKLEKDHINRKTVYIKEREEIKKGIDKSKKNVDKEVESVKKDIETEKKKLGIVLVELDRATDDLYFVKGSTEELKKEALKDLKTREEEMIERESDNSLMEKSLEAKEKKINKVIEQLKLIDPKRMKKISI